MKKIFLIVLFIAALFNAGNSFAECIQGDCNNGRGTLTTAEGIKYVGQFRNGKPDGKGTLTFPDGMKYTGELRDGRFDGHGTLDWPDGKEYEGEFRDNKLYGQGTLIWMALACLTSLTTRFYYLLLMI